MSSYSYLNSTVRRPPPCSVTIRTSHFSFLLSSSAIGSTFLQMTSSDNSNDAITSSRNHINIYPLNHYYFGSKDAVPIKDETVAERIDRFMSNYAERGMRTNVEAVLLVELFNQPHVFVLQIRNSIYKLPGGRLRFGEPDVVGLQRKLSKKISNGTGDWKVGECLGSWWRSDFDSLFYPHCPDNLLSAKECTKLFIVQLPEYLRFTVPKNQKLIAVPLRQLHENHKTYGSIISEVPQLLSKFSINVIDH
ncbi:hypothetical protein QQ045_001415 [Rhodiola kirilowii]